MTLLQRAVGMTARTFVLVIDFSADRPAYRQLADLLRSQITSGALRPGQTLPSEQRLIQEYDVSRTTVRQAVALLRSEGLVGTGHRGGGPRATYVLGGDEVVRVRPGDRVTAVGPIVVTRANGNTENYPAETVVIVDET